MSAIKDGGLLHAAKGARGDLDAWLEVHNEAEVRAAILELTDQKTLRDEFAAKVLAGLVANQEWLVESKKKVGAERFTEHVAGAAFSLADAMLAAREAQS